MKSEYIYYYLIQKRCSFIEFKQGTFLKSIKQVSNGTLDNNYKHLFYIRQCIIIITPEGCFCCAVLQIFIKTNFNKIELKMYKIHCQFIKVKKFRKKKCIPQLLPPKKHISSQEVLSSPSLLTSISF